MNLVDLIKSENIDPKQTTQIFLKNSEVFFKIKKIWIET